MTGFDSVEMFSAALRDLPQPHAAAAEAAAARQAQLTKPAGSLGRLETIALFLAGWQGNPRPVLDKGRSGLLVIRRAIP